MQRLLIISNRLPISVEKRKKGLHFVPSVGGLATGLKSFHKSYNSIWIGWPGINPEKIKGEKPDVEARLLAEGCSPVFLSKREIEDFYHGFCNKTIWPLFHYFTQYAVYNKDLWQTYERVNQAFSDAVVEVAEESDVIWIHDYHLMLLPQLVKERLPKATVGFFLHIPFPSFEIFSLKPLAGVVSKNSGFPNFLSALIFLISETTPKRGIRCPPVPPPVSNIFI